jgi:hypothetical protein
VSLNLEPAGELVVYANSVEQEFEADEFAFRHYTEAGMKSYDVAFSAGLLLNFFHLCELISPPPAVRTHPPALSRWERIKGFGAPSTYPDSWANFLDDAFAAVGRDTELRESEPPL